MSDGCIVVKDNIFIVQAHCAEARSVVSTGESHFLVLVRRNRPKALSDSILVSGDSNLQLEEALDISDIDRGEKNGNELSSPKIIASGWRGKKISNGDYTKFGASQGFDKPYDFGIGDRGGHNDEDPAKEQEKRNGDGDDGEDGEGGGGKRGERDAQEENGESVLEKQLSLLNNLDDKLAGLEVGNEYDSLFMRELKEELRRQLKAKDAIETEFYFDAAGRSRKVAEEQMLQERWMREWFDRREKMRVTSMDVRSHQLGKAKLNYQERNLPYDDGKRLHSWIWMQRVVAEIDGEWCGLDRNHEERPSPQAKLAIVYQNASLGVLRDQKDVLFGKTIF
ncbi:hypothetical protein HYALB_00011018 [Hymenoscyphus albidus]|uniref:Uncharacterized protein n=1 Tax=Hymenoscyphus albidus TaxID=595503 RepID=A0A9N9LQ00_9HELO|nr:hypothetical protein HYALB_00011018 [Hymenoscyphus albidus]